jgi:hypothetical protein
LRGAALLALLLAAPAAAAEESVLPLRLATCAALWQGYADVLGDRGERALAARFQDAAASLVGGAEAAALVAERRPWMADLLVAYTEHQDEQSRELFERLVAGCGALAGDLPELAP